MSLTAASPRRSSTRRSSVRRRGAPLSIAGGRDCAGRPARSSAAARGDERRGGVQRARRRARAALAVQQRRRELGVGARVAPVQISCVQGREAERAPGPSSRRSRRRASPSAQMLGPAGESSSSPSSRARPGRARVAEGRSTSASGSTSASAKTPTTWRRAPDRVGERPEHVEDRADPELRRRTGAAWRMAGWCDWAKRKPKPDLVDARGDRSAGRSMVTPRASSTSAEPERDDTARLPCFATPAPAPAATRPAVVEMLNVLRPSPPGAAGVDEVVLRRRREATACARASPGRRRRSRPPSRP